MSRRLAQLLFLLAVSLAGYSAAVCGWEMKDDAFLYLGGAAGVTAELAFWILVALSPELLEQDLLANADRQGAARLDA